MSALQALALGVLQGLTEFLPVSSSGHLVILQEILGTNPPGVVYEIVVHLGTLLAVAIVFRADIARIIRGMLGGRAQGAYGRLGWLVLAGTVVTGIIGVGLKPAFERLFSSLTVVGSALLVTGLILWGTGLVRAGRRDIGGLRLTDALGVGLVQALAITPGISRSGATIAGGIYLGIDRDTAARFSFLLSIPAILGAAALDLADLGEALAGGGGLSPLVLGTGFTAAFLSGLVALVSLLHLVRRGKLAVFAYYTWAVGLAVLIWQMLR